MRILYLQSTSEIGGSDVALLRIVERLDRRRFRPCVALPGDGPLVEPLRAAGCEVRFMPDMLQLTARRGLVHLARYLLNYPRAVWKLARLIRRRNVDVVHTNSLHNLYGFAAALLAGRPHVWHAREIVTQSRAARSAERLLARRFCDRLVVCSDAVGRLFQEPPSFPASVLVLGTPYLIPVELSKVSPKPPPHLRRIPDSIDLERFHPRNDGRRVVAELGLRADGPRIGIVGRLDPGKGVETFLRAAALCRRGFPTAQFLVIGGAVDGREAYAEGLRSLAGSLGLRGGGAVRFAGWRYGPERMPEVFAALDILVVASRRPEGFGLSALEAMASGKPVVATRQGGTAEVCVHGETALLVKPDDPEAMAEALLALLRGPARARALGAAGRRRAEALYDRRDHIRTLEALYDEVLREHRRMSFGDTLLNSRRILRELSKVSPKPRTP